MNPFKIKQLDEFTESDCKAYLDRYPYGEHYVEVAKRLKEIKSGKIKVDSQPTKETITSHRKSKNVNLDSLKNDSIETTDSEKIDDSSDGYDSDISSSSIDINNENSSILDKIFSIIWVIIAGVIIILIVLAVVDAFMSEDLSNFLQKHKGPIYAMLRSLLNVLKHIR